MNTKLTTILFLLSLIACSSAPKRTTEVALDEKAEADELAWIKNSDFAPKKEIPFEANKDSFKSLKVKNDILSKESVARLPSPVLESAVNLGDPLATITTLCHQKKFPEAMKLSKEKYPEYRSHAGYWNQVATCYLLQGELDKAQLYYQKSRDQNPKYSPPVNNLGVMYQREGDDQKALKAYEEASKLGSFSITPMFNMAQLYMKYGLINKAKELLGSLYSMNSKDVEVLSALGTLSLIENEVSQSIKYFSQIPATDLSRADLAVNFAIAVKLSGDNARATAIFRGMDKTNINISTSYYESVEKYIGM